MDCLLEFYKPGTSLQKPSGTSVHIQWCKSARDHLDKNLLPRERALILVPQPPAYTSSAVHSDNSPRPRSAPSSLLSHSLSRANLELNLQAEIHFHPFFLDSLQGASWRQTYHAHAVVELLKNASKSWRQAQCRCTDCTCVRCEVREPSREKTWNLPQWQDDTAQPPNK